MKFVFQLLEQEIKRYEKSIEALSALFKATGDEGIQESLLRDEEYRDQFQRAYEILSNSEPDVQAGVATEVDSSKKMTNKNP